MRSPLHVPTAVATLCLCAGLFALSAFVRPQQAPVKRWEFKITLDVEEDGVQALSRDGWEYVGYMGTSTRGASVDEVLWKRPAK